MFYFDNIHEKKILKSDMLQETNAFFTTREFVLTPAQREDLTPNANLNMKQLFEYLKIKKENLITVKQVHSDNIAIVRENINFYDNTDAIVSNIPNTVLLMNFADCVPVILFSKKNNTGAVIHAGWRGTAQNISYKTAKTMLDKFNCKPEDIKALIGPAIGKCCFQTDKDVFEKLVKNKSDKDLYNLKNDKYYIDLKLLNKRQLNSLNIYDIDICNCCTVCMSDTFFSYRKECGKTARHSAILKINQGEI